MTPKNQEKDGAWQDSDFIECDPEYQDIYEDNVIDFLKEENPEMLAIMKRAGLNAD